MRTGGNRAYVRRWWRATLHLAQNRGFVWAHQMLMMQMAIDPRMRTQGVSWVERVEVAMQAGPPHMSGP